MYLNKLSDVFKNDFVKKDVYDTKIRNIIKMYMILR